MSTHNIGFYEDLTKIIFQLSLNTHLISSSGKHGSLISLTGPYCLSFRSYMLLRHFLLYGPHFKFYNLRCLKILDFHST